MQLQLEHREAPSKKLARVKEKVERAYNGDVSRVLDFERSSIVVESAMEAIRALNIVLDQAIVFTIKNRYSLSYNGKATGGYRDINIQLSFEEFEGTPFAGYVFELQIVFATFLEVKSEEGHRRYVLCRNLRGD